ncbi:MAG: SurA N-terminal domain-containing protein [Kiritimatiellia bacterium]|nr:SurA N-terminal domain-containing protein [Kiritimatiellia bacterium]MDP6847353.1 SurA N-terminal domain-containing protein [Kiritimatiellia bacterium]
MLITKFNKMIRNRFLWGIFAVLISVSFVFAFSQGGCEKSTSTRAAGRIYGEDVSPEELQAARFFELGLQRNVNLPPEAYGYLRERAWQRIAALKTADQLGITVSKGEILQAIQGDRTFLENGVFNKDRYIAIVQRQIGVNLNTFEEYVRQELMLQKLERVSDAFVWTSPMELQDRLDALSDPRAVAYVLLPKKEFTPDVEVTSEDAKDYYEANTNMFIVPEKVSVLYVSFDITNYMDGIEILETNVVEYYNDHIEEYSTTDTNGESVATPLAEVKTNIFELLRNEAALEKGKVDATELAVALAPGRYTEATSFEEATKGLSVSTTEFFALEEDVPGLNVGSDFRQIAFDLDANDPEMYFSDAIAGEDSVYVIAAGKRQDSHLPEFEEISEEVMPLAVTNALEEAYENRIETVRNSIAGSLSDGKSFSDAAAEFKLNVSTTAEFTVYGGLPEGSEHAEILPMSVMNLEQGEMSEPIPVGDDDRLLVYLSSRTLSPAGTTEMLRPQLLRSLDRYRAGAAYQNWRQAMLEASGFEDLSKPVGDDEKEDLDEDS